MIQCLYVPWKLSHTLTTLNLMCIYQTFKNDIEKNIQILYVDLPKVGFNISLFLLFSELQSLALSVLEMFCDEIESNQLGTFLKK
jgi:hypothetical protein